MNVATRQGATAPWETALPEHRDLYYGGGWHAPVDGGTAPTFDPGRGVELCGVAEASKADVDKAVAAARAGFQVWRDVAPLERARILKQIAQILRDNARELAIIDAVIAATRSAR